MGRVYFGRDMTIDFTCQKCDGSFELDAQDLIDGTEKLMCPNCDAKAPPALAEDFSNALSELRLQVANLSKKFTVTMAVETEDVEEELDADEEDDDEDEEALDEDDDEDEGDDDDEDDEEEGEDEDVEER